MRWRKYSDPHAGGPMREDRPIICRESHAVVPLTQGHEAIIDRRDVAAVSRHKWHAVADNNTVYALTSILNEDGQYRKVGLHAFIMGSKFGKRVDHRDGNGLNNRRGNLRFATASQNQWNKALSRNNTSGYKGVRLDHRDNLNRKWRATIYYDGKHHSLGYHATPEDDALAYDDAARNVFGEFARLNETMSPGSSTHG